MIGDMQREFIETIKSFPLRAFVKGERLFQVGQPIDRLYAIRRGYARVDSYDRNGNEQLIWLASRYDIIPTESLFRRHGELQFSYIALTNLEVYEIPKLKFLEMCDSSPQLVHEVAKSMSLHYDDLLMRLRAVEQSSVRDKLIHTLHYIATRFGSDTTVRLEDIGLQLSHQDIARMIGATRETTAIELKRLKDTGMIDYTRSSFTIQVTQLEELL